MTLLAVLSPLYLLSASEHREKAEAEGAVVFYATMSTSDAKGLTDGFRQLYPKIDAQFYRTTDAQMMERVLTEARAGRHLWDVVATTSFYGRALKKRGFFAPYDSPERKYYRDGYKDPQAFWTSTYTNYAVLGYNTRSVLKNAVPNSHADLLKPEWKGQIGMEGRAYEWFATVVSRMGEERGQEILRSLKRIPDRLDTLPDPPRLVTGIKPAFASPEVFDDFDRYVRLFQEIFKAR